MTYMFSYCIRSTFNITTTIDIIKSEHTNMLHLGGINNEDYVLGCFCLLHHYSSYLYHNRFPLCKRAPYWPSLFTAACESSSASGVNKNASMATLTVK